MFDGGGVVTDCRPVSKANDGFRHKSAVNAAACSVIGWDFAVVGEPDPVWAANLRWLAGYRHPRFGDEHLEATPDRTVVYDYHAHLGLWRVGLRLDEGAGLYYRYMELVEQCREELAEHGYGKWTAREVDLALFTHGQHRGFPRPRPWK
jgi:hypothetical protein